MTLIGVPSEELGYLECVAPIAYTFCVGLFGEPVDAERLFEIHRDFPRSMCSYNALLRCYIVEIDKRYHTHEQLLGIELQRTAGPEAVARIVGAASIAEWMSELTDEQYEHVKSLLNSV